MESFKSRTYPLTIAIIIPTFNRKNELLDLLRQIMTQVKSQNRKFIIIVVNDGSTDGTNKSMVEQFPSVNTVHGNGHWWYTRSINEGFKEAKKNNPDYLLFLNDDMVLGDNYIENIIDAASIKNDPSIYGSISYSVEKPEKITFLGVKNINKWLDKTYENDIIDSNDNELNLVESTVLPGRGLLVPISIMEELQGFDNKFFQYQSDFDFCLRAQKKGYKSYIVTSAKVYEYEYKTSGSTTRLKPGFNTVLLSLFDKKSRYYIPNRSRYYWRHYYKALWPFYTLKYIIRIFLKSSI